MVEGFEYKHYKGGTYEVIGIAMSYSSDALKLMEFPTPYQVCDAHSVINEIDMVNIWEKAGIMMIDSTLPHVIYRSYNDNERGREYGETWARPVNAFFEHVLALDSDFELKKVPRFSFILDHDLEKKLEKKELQTV